MSSHRLVAASDKPTFRNTAPPFSNFDFVDSRYGSQSAIRRILSQARSYGCQTIVVENIPPVGILEEDNKEIAELRSDFQPGNLQRLSFWTEHFTTPEDVATSSTGAFLGYAILKQDLINGYGPIWYVFESVVIQYPHEHNCVHGATEFDVRVCDTYFTVTGILYCQQNGVNKACAQVALRSLLAMHLSSRDISYHNINSLAGVENPSLGLSVGQMRKVFEGCGIGYYDIAYQGLNPEARKHLPPYQKLVYAGIESGGGALLGFRLSGENMEEDVRHIIPLFGHTFNQDAWVPRAESAYFHIGENTRYLPSESWVSSFIGHDDNFGSNFCIPRLYVEPEQVDYVAELYLDGCKYSGVVAESIAVDYLYSVLPELAGNNLSWLTRLITHVRSQEVVLRAIAVTSKEYVKHWQSVKDWDGNQEDKELCNSMKDDLPSLLWLVEISMPELFPSNLHKVGEIVLDATKTRTNERDFSLFVWARVPGSIIPFQELGSDGTPNFGHIRSDLASHVPLYGYEHTL